MDTGHIKGSGSVGGNPEGLRRVDPGRPTDGQPARPGDAANISDGSRETVATVDAMVSRLHGDLDDRRQYVEAARRLLESGRFDQPEVFLEASRKMLMDGF